MKGVKIGVIVVCLGLAGFLFARSRHSSEDIPDTPESATTWMCRACNHDYSLTAKQFDVEERRVTRKQDHGIGPLICPKCGKEEAWRANRCPTHNRMFFIMGVPGSTGLCPECNPPAQRTPVEEGPAPEPKKPAAPSA